MAERTEQSKHAATDTDRFAAQDAAFNSNLATLNTLTAERETLENEMRQNGSMTAGNAGLITAEIVELADPPTRHNIRRMENCSGNGSAGGVVAGAGIIPVAFAEREASRGGEKAV